METKYVRVPFDVELAKKISSGEIEGKVSTRDGRNARIIFFDAKGTKPIIALLDYGCEELPYSYSKRGLYSLEESIIFECDLILEIPEYMKFEENSECHFCFRQLVLVRNDTSTKWLPAEFGFDNGDGWIVTIGGLTFRYCIPYEGNENLLGTKEKSVKNDIVKNENVLTIDEIRKAANKAALVEYDLKLINEAEYQVAKRFFELGTNWFRTLAWKNSNETPETSKLLLVECKDGSISLCKFSKENTDTSKWKRWMYVKNLIPCLED